MKNQKVRILGVGVTLVTGMFAQNAQQRQATMMRGEGPDRGKCTVEVVVDSVAQVEIRGMSASLRTLSGQPAQWRRFECTGALPGNPADFRFAGVDGRGRQQLIRDPRNGGVAVVEIEDRDGGAEGYTFDIFWDMRGGGGGGGPISGGPPPNYQDRDQRGPGNRDDDGYRPNYRDSEYYRRNHRGFGVQEAVRVCEEAVQTRASRRFRTNNIQFNRTRIDDKPGRNDWVIGSIDVRRGPREEQYGFACSVNFDNGNVRSADIDSRPRDDRRYR
jgi:hypothetical protein